MIIQNKGNPSLADLMHYGVKGMKWGERKAEPSKTEILNARARVDAQARQIHNAADKVNSLQGAAQTRAAKEYADKVKAFQQDEARVTAQHMTQGERVAAVILTGPIALLVIGGSKRQVRKTAEDVDESRQFYAKKPKN